MNSTKRPVNNHKAYHAHIYFDESNRATARALCDKIDHEFDLRIGRFHEQLVGPHPCWSCQVTFGKRDFATFIPWLDSHRQGLTIFVHGLTGDDIKDHTDFAYWLGDEVALNLAFFGID